MVQEAEEEEVCMLLENVLLVHIFHFIKLFFLHLFRDVAAGVLSS